MANSINGAGASAGFAGSNSEAASRNAGRRRQALLGSSALIGIMLTASPAIAQTIVTPTGGGTIVSDTGTPDDRTAAGGGVRIYDISDGSAVTVAGVTINQTVTGPTPNALSLEVPSGAGGLGVTFSGTNAISTIVSGGAAVAISNTGNLSVSFSSSGSTFTGSNGFVIDNTNGFAGFNSQGQSQNIVANGTAVTGISVAAQLNPEVYLGTSTISGFATGVNVTTTDTRPLFALVNSTGGSISALQVGINVAPAAASTGFVESQSAISAPTGIRVSGGGGASITTSGAGTINSVVANTGTGIAATSAGTTLVNVGAAIGNTSTFATAVDAVATGTGTVSVSSSAAIRAGASGTGIRAVTAGGTNNVSTTTGGTINAGNIGIFVSGATGTNASTVTIGAAIGGTTRPTTGVSATGAGVTGDIINANANVSGLTSGVLTNSAFTTNIASGVTVTGSTSGIRMAAGGGTVNNAGTLSGQYGVESNNLSRLRVNNSGTITGTAIAGIFTGSTDLIITNSGTLQGTSADGIFAYNSGTVNNTGMITSGTSGRHAVLLSGNGVKSVVNSGTISSASTAVDTNAVFIGTSGTTTVTNQNGGTITSAGGYGVRLDGIATLNNNAGATIAYSGNNNRSGAAVLLGGAATLNNLGTIDMTGTSGQGVIVNGGATINNGSVGNTTALIRSTPGTAVLITGNIASTTNNYGRIQGGNGIAHVDGGTGAVTVNNLGASSIIFGSSFGGILGESGGLTVQNAGLIASTGLGGGNAIGSIGATTITNTGTIGTGTVDGAGAFTAGGAGSAISTTGNATITNSGTLFGNSFAAITNATNSVLTVTNSGTISSGSTGDALASIGTVNVVNGGMISTSVFSAVNGINGGSVVNAAAGTLMGGNNATFGEAVQFGTGTASFTNYGTASSAIGKAVFVTGNAATTINLQAGSTTGSIQTGNGNDTLALYNGRGTGSTATVDGPSGMTLQNAGTLAGATVGAINLGGGTNTLTLRGTGDGTAANGATGTITSTSIAGLSNLAKLDSGMWTLTGAGNYSGTTTVSGGTLRVLNTGAGLGNGAASVASGATLQFDNQTGGAYALKSTTLTGAGRLLFTGSAGSNVSFGNAGNVTVSLSQGGLIDVQSGSVSGSASGQGFFTGNMGSLNIASGAIFDGVEGNVIVDGLTGAGSLRGGFSGSGSTTIGIANANATFSGVISNSTNPNSPLNLIKVGTGTQTLTGANTYTGDTTISQGTLAIAGTGSIANSRVIANGTLDISAVPQSTARINTINKTDTIFGTFNQSTLADVPGTFNFRASSYGLDGKIIGFTNAEGVIVSLLRLDNSPISDRYDFFNVLSGDAAIGTNCISGANVACLIATGAPQDLLPTISFFNGNLSLCCGGASFTATINDSFGSPVTIRSLGGTGSVVLGGAVLALTNANDSFSGSITGTTGGLRLVAGNQTLTGTGNWTGLTTIVSGTLTGTSNSISGGSIVDNGVLVYDQAFAGTVAQNISGTGSVNVAGSGMVTLSGALSVAGQLTASGTDAQLVLSGARTGSTGTGVVLSGINAGLTIASMGSVIATGSNNGVLITGSGAQLTNAGTVSTSGAANANAVFSNVDTAITNSGNLLGVAIAGAAAVQNNHGIFITAAGLSTIDNTGTILGGSDGIRSIGAVALTNSGTIAGNQFAGVETTEASTTINSGTIRGYSELGSGVLANGTTSVVNQAGGRIIGDGTDMNGGVYARFGAALDVTNAGLILGTQAYGIRGEGTGTVGATGFSTVVTNNSGGEIVGSFAGIETTQLASITNNGLIGSGGYDLANNSYGLGGQDGIRLLGGGTVDNGAGAQILGSDGSGIYAEGAAAVTVTNLGTISSSGGTAITGTNGPVTISNFGTIIGDVGAISLADADDVVTLNVGSVTDGSILLGGGDDTLNYRGGTFTAAIDGGTGDNAFDATLEEGSASLDFGNVFNFTSHVLESGTLTLTGTREGGAGFQSNDGTSLIVDGIFTGLTTGFTSQSGTSAATLAVQAGAVIDAVGGNAVDYFSVAANDVTNAGTISSGFDGVYLGGGSLSNTGTISGGTSGMAGYGVRFNSTDNEIAPPDISWSRASRMAVDGTFINAAGGVINAGNGGAILLEGTGSYSVTLEAGSTVNGLFQATGTGNRTVTIGGTLNGAYDASGNAGIDAITLIEGGSMTSADLGDGDDRFDYLGGMISGLIDGGAGTDALLANFGAGTNTTVSLANFINFESFGSMSGDLTLTGPSQSPGADINSTSGTTTFINTSNMTGDIYVNGGDIRATTAGAFGTGTIHLIDPLISYGATGVYANNISLEVVIPASADPSTLLADPGVVATLTGSITQGMGGAIDPFQPLVITGLGTIVLNNTANSWAGTTTIDAGATLQGASNTISGSAIIANGALAFVQPLSGTFALGISGNGGTSVAGLTLSEAFTYAGTSTANGGFTIADASTLVNTGTITTTVQNAVTINNGGTLDNRGAINGSVVNIGATTATLINAATLNGTIVNGGSGMLVIDNRAGGTISSTATAIDATAGSAIQLTNGAGGTISAATNAVAANGQALIDLQAGSVTNGGILLTGNQSNVVQIAGSFDGALLAGAGNDLITLVSGLTLGAAVTIDAGAGSDGLILTGAGNATLDVGLVSNVEARTKNGAGTWTLTGIDTQAAGWQVNTGTLALMGGTAINDAASVTIATQGNVQLLSSEAINALNGSGTVALGANTLTLTGGTGSFAGVIGGSGGVTIVNNAAATLSGSNSYTGLTLINGGILTLGASNVLADATVLQVRAGTVDLQGFNETVSLFQSSGVLNGTGTLTATRYDLNGAVVNANLGGGTLTQVGGTSTLNGTAAATTVAITGGTLTLGASDRLANGAAVTVANGTTLALGGFNDTVGSAVLAGTLAGTGTLTATRYDLNGAVVNANLGGGTLTQVGGTSTLNGTAAATAVSIMGGTLVLGADERLANAATVQIASGAVFNLAGRTETVGTLGGMGTLALGNGRLVAGSSNADFSYNGAVTGSGDLEKIGTGTFFLAGNLAQTGRLALTAGTTLFTGSTAGSVRVQGGTLTGGAAIAGNLTIASGSFSPGTTAQPIGAFSAGSFNASGGTFVFDLGGPATAFAADMINVSGNAVLTGGTVVTRAIEPTGNYRVSQTYVVLRSAGLTGTFANGSTLTPTGNNPDLQWRLRYDLVPNAVVLELRKQIDFMDGLGPNATANELAVGRSLNGGAFMATDNWAGILNTISGQDIDTRRATFNSISGESISDISSAAAIAASGFTDLLRQRLATGGSAAGNADLLTGLVGGKRALVALAASAPLDGAALPSSSADFATDGRSSRVGAWLQGYGANGRIDGLRGQAGIDTYAAGVAGGIDVRAGYFTIGGAFATSQVETKIRSRTSTNEGVLYQGGGYVAYDDGRLYGSVIGSYFSGDFDSRRSVFVGGSQVGVATGTTKTRGYTAGASLGYRLPVSGGLLFTPQASFTATGVTRGAFTETGVGGLSIDSARADRTLYAASGEGRLSRPFNALGGTVEPFIGGGAIYSFGDLDTFSANRFTGAPTGTGSYTITGARLAPLTALVTGGLDVRPSKNVRLGLQGEARLSQRQREERISLNLRIGF